MTNFRFSFLAFFFVFSASLFLGADAFSEPPVKSVKGGSLFNGFYGGIDASFVSNESKGTIGPIMVSVAGQPAQPQGPFSFGGTDKLPGGSLFAGYGMTLKRVFLAVELAGSYGSYDNTKAFSSPNFTSDIDITEGYFGTSGRLGFLLKENLMIYSSVGWGRSWVEAKGKVSNIAIPNPLAPGNLPLPLNQPVKTDVTFDGVSFGCGIEYALGEIVGIKGIRARLAYSRLEQGKEKFSYNTAGLETKNLAEGIPGVPPVIIDQTSIPVQADASANVFSLGLLYSL